MLKRFNLSLPEDLAAATHFSFDEKGKRLLLDFAVKLEKSDYPVVLTIVKKFNGDFGNRKEKGKDVGFFFVPKPKPAAIPGVTSSITLEIKSNETPAAGPGTILKIYTYFLTFTELFTVLNVTAFMQQQSLWLLKLYFITVLILRKFNYYT